MVLTNTAIGLIRGRERWIDTAIVLVVPIYVLPNLIRWVTIFPISRCYGGRGAVEFSVALVDGEPCDGIQVALIPATLPSLNDEPILQQFFAGSV